MSVSVGDTIVLTVDVDCYYAKAGDKGVVTNYEEASGLATTEPMNHAYNLPTHFYEDEFEVVPPPKSYATLEEAPFSMILRGTFLYVIKTYEGPVLINSLHNPLHSGWIVAVIPDHAGPFYEVEATVV